MGLSRKEITEIVIGLLFHDALHQGFQQYDDEVNSFEALASSVDETDYAFMGLVKNNKTLARSREVILATIFNDRGKTPDEILRMVQDSDIGHIGQGPIYWPWASMGLVDEFVKQKLTNDAISFIKSDQRLFVEGLCKVSGTGRPFLSEAANKVFIDPLESLAQVEALNPNQIMFAYNNRFNDLTVEEFERGLKKAA
jgi:hypothetical protein